MNYKHILFVLSTAFVSGCTAQDRVNEHLNKSDTLNPSSLFTKTWYHGSPICNKDTQPTLDVYRQDKSTFIIRQNKCLTFEAPFIYVLVGEKKTLIFDTGALADAPEFSFKDEIKQIIGEDAFQDNELIIVHSHSHSDHYQGDVSFNNLPNVTLTPPNKESVRKRFAFDNWPHGQYTIDLGLRKVVVIPTPGHQEEAVTIYDAKTKWLMTGDTLYPGYIYIKNWGSYRNSINRLTDFSYKNQVTAILGAHIEMKNKPGVYYPIGSTYQPDEVSLPLSVEHLYILNNKLKNTPNPTEIIFDHFILKPMGRVQKTISNIIRWVTQ